MRNLKEFIEVNKDDINLRLFEKVYSLADEDLSYTGIGQLTELLYKCGVDPLNYLNKIPNNYACNSSISKITIPVNIKSIGYSAFDRCASLTSIIIPDSVLHIGDYAFNDCTSLASIIIPNSVTSIGDSAFQLCISLKSITIPNSVKSIGDNAFLNCSSLANVTIPDSVISIGGWTFYYCTSLTSVIIGEGVKSIGSKVFGRCPFLKTINYKGSKKQWKAIDLYPGWKNSSSIETVRCTDGDIEA